ncbi:MAG: hypothetical protein IKO14_05175 [Oscillibacter sp.]|jgi:hypothetical protein|nr:hypothetical protein [Oscillibacter sp.]
MYPLIEIKSVPIELQFKTTNASLEYTRGTAEMEISRSEQGGVNVRSRPIQVKLDTFEQRGGQFSAANAAVSAAVGQPSQAQYEATSAYAEQGQIQLSARIGKSIPQAAAPAQTGGSGYTAPDIQTGVDVKWEDGAMEIRYAMDKLNFDWKIDKGEFKFTPGDIEISVAQKPSLTIKYTGGPIYVPRSADPNYQPVDVNA